MSCFPLSDPPELGDDAKYEDYRPWLLVNFYRSLCAYCLLRDDDVQIEHYEPTSFRPDRKNDPSNLLLACSRCNGRGGKGDYHPAHESRRRIPHDTTEHLVVDIRVDDFGELFSIDPLSGKIEAKAGTTQARSAWNITLLKLDLPFREERRQKLVDAVEAAAGLIDLLEDSDLNCERDSIQAALGILLKEISEHELFFIAYNVPVPTSVAERVREISPRCF